MRHVTAVLLLCSAFYLLTSASLRQGPYDYDESDYMHAASQGLAANWFDTPSLSLVAFVQIGLGAGRDPSQRSQLSETIRSSGDILFYRHWHGPLYFYGLSFLSGWGLSEQQIRAAVAFIPALGILFVYFATRWLFPAKAFLPFGVAGLYGLGHSVVATTELAPHQLFVLASLVPIFCLAKLQLTGDLRWWRWAAVTMSLSFVTMELAVVGIAVMVLLGWVHRSEWRLNLALLRRTILLFSIPSLLLWPAGLVKLAVVRSYLFMSYLAVFRRGAWGDVTFTDTWATRLHAAPVEWLLVAACVALWGLRGRRPAFRAATPFLLFGFLMLVVTLKVYASSPRYVLPVLAPLLVAAGIVFGIASERFQTRGALSAACLVIAVGAGSWRFVRTHRPHPDERAVRLLAQVRSLQGPLLVPQTDVPMLHYYFPEIPLKAYRNPEEQAAALKAGGVQAMVVDMDAVNPVRMLP